jgi:hypothetical protein
MQASHSLHMALVALGKAFSSTSPTQREKCTPKILSYLSPSVLLSQDLRVGVLDQAGGTLSNLEQGAAVTIASDSGPRVWQQFVTLLPSSHVLQLRPRKLWSFNPAFPFRRCKTRCHEVGR